MCVNNNTAVLLQTAQAVVGQPGNSGQKVKARIVFDPCSQRTYVTQRLQKTLNLHPVGSDMLKITAFGEYITLSCVDRLPRLSRRGVCCEGHACLCVDSTREIACAFGVV